MKSGENPGFHPKRTSCDCGLAAGLSSRSVTPVDTEHQAVMAANWPLTALAAQSEPSPKWAAGAGKQAQHGEAGRRCNMTRGAGGSHAWSHARRPSPVESGNRGNAELGACGVRGCTGVGVKKVARDVRFDVMAGRTRCLNVTRYNRARHTKGSFCSFPPRHTKRRRRSAGEGGRVARETHRGRPVRSPTTLLATLSPAGEE